MSRPMRRAWMVIALVALVLMLVGLRRGEFAAVRTQANTLCTACIGLTAGE